jgi:hypothetical protein
MREFREIRKGLGDNADAAAPYLGVARTQLGILKTRMAHGGLVQLTRTIQLEDGTSITVSSRMGQDSVQITAASTNQPAVPSRAEFQEVRVGEPDDALITDFSPDLALVFTPGDSEIYSRAYSSSIVKGAVMDKTGKTVFLALASPDVDQSYGFYNPLFSNASQLIKLDHTLKQVGQFGVAAPDWGGQLTYDFTTDRFFLNAWTARDYRFQGNQSVFQGHVGTETIPYSHRTLVMITADGAQFEMPASTINSGSSVTDTLWGNSSYFSGITINLRLAGSPSGGYAYLSTTQNWLGSYGSAQSSDIYPLSQPSTSGLIAAMYQGIPYYAFDTSSPNGFPFVWDTRAQAIVWRGESIGSYKGDPSTDSIGSLIYTHEHRVDPWAVITPSGNAIFSVNGAVMIVPLGGPVGFSAPPAGTIDMAVTKGDKSAFAMSTGALLQFVKGGWKDVTPGGAAGKLRAVLHDLVTDAVAVVLNDGSGVWIFNGHDGRGMPLAPFKVGFSRPPTRDPAFTYPQQFINGSLLITYAMPGTAVASRDTQFVPMEFVFSNLPFPEFPPPYGMPSIGFPGQHQPAWRGGLGRPGFDEPQVGVLPQSTAWGSMTPYSWVIGRYDIGQLKATGSA